MEKLDWAQVINFILPLIGVVVGGMITYLTQISYLNKQFKTEKLKDLEGKNTTRLLVYNEILKLDGENLMRLTDEYGYAEFNGKIFIEKFRPHFYSNFHLIHQEIANKLIEMDSILIAERIYEGEVIEESANLLPLYDDILDLIYSKQKESREKYFHN